MSSRFPEDPAAPVPKSASRQVGSILGLVLFCSRVVLGEVLAPTQPLHMGAVASRMACWWLTEAVPLAATSLLFWQF